MAVDERDPYTGYMTTGHEWNGIKELNSPVPRPVYFFLIVTALFSVIYWALMPAWPLGVTYTKGLLGIDQRQRKPEAGRSRTGRLDQTHRGRKLQGNPGRSPIDG
jgi:cytochrome c oxidase cbb3-type subunit 3